MAFVKTDFTKVMAPAALENFAARKHDLFSYLMVVVVLLTLVSVFHVWSRVKVIDLNLKISDLKRQMKEQQQEQNRFNLEVASLKTPARIETLAKGELGMRLPSNQQVVMVK